MCHESVPSKCDTFFFAAEIHGDAPAVLQKAAFMSSIRRNFTARTDSWRTQLYIPFGSWILSQSSQNGLPILWSRCPSSSMTSLPRHLLQDIYILTASSSVSYPILHYSARAPAFYRLVISYHWPTGHWDSSKWYAILSVEVEFYCYPRWVYRKQPIAGWARDLFLLGRLTMNPPPTTHPP